jgi:hypothetical protein
MKIKIRKSPTADTRTCDFANVSKDKLIKSSIQHIEDVQCGIYWIVEKLLEVAKIHDNTKLSEIDMFHKDFISGFETTEWWNLHKKKERHHISQPDGVREDVDLIDVIEFLVDCVMAGMARSGEYRFEKLSDGLLETAFINTVNKLIKDIETAEQQPQQ